MLAAVGDLVDDIVVRVGGAVNVASDTDAVITRRRGGSAANVAAVAARLVGSSRFLGQVGDDAVGDVLLAELAAEGVDVACVRRGGRTGTIVVLVDAHGERTMLTDRASAVALDRPSPAWLDGIGVLHVPWYSLAGGPIAATAATTIEWAHARGIAVSVDASSVAVLEEAGAGAVRHRLDALRPTVMFANAAEAAVLGIDGPVAGAITFVKHGADPAVVHVPGRGSVTVPPPPLAGVADTTGAGDAFAAGVLVTAGWQDDPVAACWAGHRAAARLLTSR